MDGKQFRLQRFLARSDRLVVAAMDHGAFHGPIAGLENPGKACRQLVSADAVLLAPGMIQHVAGNFTGPNAPWLITRLAWNSTYCFQWRYCDSHHRPLLTVAEALAKGADIVLASLSLKTGNERVDAENAGLFSQYVQQAGAMGVPIIGEYYPAKTETMPARTLHENIRIGCRILAELGADVIKTFYTGPRFAEIVEATPVPILILGAAKTPTEAAALTLAGNAAKSGARGIVFGRNIVQSRSPAGFIQAVRAVMNGKCTAAEAVATYKLKG
jgi:DhnA family fructose-bisphosphate aldolase class Ia